MNINHMNLKLLLAFDALLDTCHVTRAAKQLHLSQSAMSKLLIKLRHVFNDPILLRHGHHMMPTERAIGLHQQIKEILLKTEDVFSQPAMFDPAQLDKQLRILVPDGIASLLMPGLMTKLVSLAPKLCFYLQSLAQKETNAAIEQLRADMAISYGFALPKGLKSMRLYQDRVVCVCRAGHPLLHKETISIKDYLRYSHIVLSDDPGSHLLGDQWLQDHGYAPRTVVVRLGQVMTAFCMVQRSDLLCTMGWQMLKPHMASFGLAYRALPSGVPGVPIHLLWHPVYDQSPWHQWLRCYIKDHAKQHLAG